MTDSHKRERKPWSPTIEGEPLLNAFANPLSCTGEPDDPVSLVKLDSENEESVGGDPIIPETISPTVLAAEIKSTE
jgi:hypothetical protein